MLRALTASAVAALLRARKSAPLPRFVVAAPMKTATQTAYASVQAVFGSENVFHTHWLAADIPNRSDKSFPYRAYSKQQNSLRALLDPSKSQIIISLIRDPMDRLFSHLFHEQARVIVDAWKNRTIKPALPILEQRTDHILNLCKDYYRRQFGPLGIDPFKQIAPSGRTFRMFKAEDMKETLPREIKRLTGRDIVIIRKNDATAYGPQQAYEWFKAAYRLPKKQIHQLYEDRAIRTHYTDGEINAAKARWLG